MITGKRTLAEIAGYDYYQMRYVLFRERDKYGGLVRRPSDLPPGVEVDEEGMRVVRHPVAYARMFQQVCRYRGVPESQRGERWREFLQDNPKFGRGGEE